MPAHPRPCHLLVVLPFACLASPPSAGADSSSAKNEPGPVWTIQNDPLTTTLGIAHVLFERRVSEHMAVYTGPSLRLYDSPLTPDDEEGYRAYGLESGARYFFSGTAPIGYWAGLRLTVAQMSYDGESRIGGYASALAGRAWLLGGRWILSGALGVSYFDYQVGGVGVEGVLPAAHTGIGFAF